MAAEENAPPYWVLISVLFSSLSLNPALARTLHQIAYELHRHGGTEGEIHSDAAMGTVRNLHKDMQLGTISGPAFEAKVDTPQGSGEVRFLLTRQGLAWMAEHEGAAPKGPSQYLH